MNRLHDNRRAKSALPKFDVHQLADSCLICLECTKGDINSSMLIPRLQYVRMIAIYVLFMYSNYTSKKIQSIFNVSIVRINKFVSEAHLLIERGDKRTCKDVLKILNTIKK